MRDIPGLMPLLNRASARAEEHPRYRFHGRRSPANRQLTPVRAEVPGGNITDGVATLRLYEPIDSWGAPWGVSALEFLDALDQVPSDVDEIRLHINCPGGEVWEALAILNNLREHAAPVTAIVDGIAASAASFIACAADKTIMRPNSQLMIHDAWGMCVGNAGDMHSTGDLLGQISDNIAAVYADKSGGSTEDWRAIMLDEGWYVAQEAVDAGLADVVEGAQIDGDPAAAFDLKGAGMKFAGRAEAPAPKIPKPPRQQAPAPAESADDRRARFQALRERRHQKRAS